MQEILIPNPRHVQDVIVKMSAQGSQHFHVVADFDRTLTKPSIGQERSSLESIFEEQWFLWEGFFVQAQKAFDTYYPIEMDPNIPLEDKKMAMHGRWMSQFDLMLKSGLTKDMIVQAMKSDKIIFRPWSDIFFDLLKDNRIPLLIFSGSGLWYDGIASCLQNVDKFFDNIHIISNAFIRDE